uniref:BHLH domain-containing protein n=1 Tax=Setaria digitata TaxID=48799 RepID=A0A915PXS8_9BILA
MKREVGWSSSLQRLLLSFCTDIARQDCESATPASTTLKSSDAERNAMDACLETALSAIRVGVEEEGSLLGPYAQLSNTLQTMARSKIKTEQGCGKVLRAPLLVQVRFPQSLEDEDEPLFIPAVIGASIVPLLLPKVITGPRVVPSQATSPTVPFFFIELGLEVFRRNASGESIVHLSLVRKPFLGVIENSSVDNDQKLRLCAHSLPTSDITSFCLLCFAPVRLSGSDFWSSFLTDWFMTLHFMAKMMASPYASPSPPQYPLERKLKKPLMEKRRRARMNECLDQLKHLLLHISPNHRTKLEKADILEMTVAYLNQMQHPPSPSTSFDNNAIYQQSYAEGFTVAASACLAYLQNTLPPSEFAPEAQQFRIGLIQHLQSVMSNHVNPPGEDPGSVPSQLVSSYRPANFQMRPSLASSYLASNYLSSLPYPQSLSVAYQRNMSGFYGTPSSSTPISVPSQTNIISTSKDLIPRPVAIVGAQTALSGFRTHRGEKHSRHLELAKGNETKEKLNELEGVGTNVKVWRPF